MSRSEWTLIVRLVPPGRVPERIDIDDRVLSWEFDDAESESDKLTITVDNHDLRNFDTPVWRKGAEIEVQFGYLDNLSLARRMIIKKVTGGLQLSVVAFSKAYLLDTVKRCRTFENMTRSGAVELIADANGFAQEARFIESTETIHETIQQARQTDAQFIRDMARREGFEFYVDANGLHFHPRRIEEPPIRKLVWYRDRTGTLIGFNIKNDVSQQPSRYRIVGRDRMAKKDFSFDVDATADIRRTLAPKADVPSAPERIVDSLSFVPVVGVTASAIVQVVKSREPNESAARKAAERRIARRRQNTVQMEGTIVGDPTLPAKSIVAIEGLGTTLDGNYYVKRHRHIGGAGYTGQLELIRDGRNQRPGGEQLFLSTRSANDADSNSCSAALGHIRQAVADLVQLRNDSVREVAEKGILFTKTAIEQTSDQLRRMVVATDRLDDAPREQLKPVLDEIFAAAAKFIVPTTLMPKQVGTALRRAATDVLNAVGEARGSCATEPAPAVNELSIEEQEAAQLRDLGGGNFDFKL